MSDYWVTGASGCLGTALATRLLEKGHGVVLVVKPGAPVAAGLRAHPRASIRVADLADLDQACRALEGAGAVFHAAGLASPLESDRPLLWEANVSLTQNVVTAAEVRGVTRLVHVSSSAAIGYPPDGMVADESFAGQEARLANAYSQSKVAAEKVVTDAVRRGLDAVLVNPTAVLAPGGHARFGWQALLGRAVRGGMAPIPPGGSGFCTGDDFARGAMAAMEHGRVGERYILSSENLTFAELADRLRAVGAWRGRTVQLPKGLLNGAGRLGAVWNALSPSASQRIPLTPEVTVLMQRRLYYSPRKAERELGFAPSRVDEALRVLSGPLPADRAAALAGGGR